MLIIAIIAMMLALICYSIGVWGEKIVGKLTRFNLMFFWIGLVFDTIGTTIMSIISESFKFDIHGVTGLLAIVLMLFHAIWATIVLVRNKEKLMIKFHKFSLFVWIIWLISFITGMVLNIA